MSKDPQTSAAAVMALARVPASDVKRRGWRGVVRTLRTEGAVLVTNHDQPEAVILSAEAYADLLDRAKQVESPIDSDLTALRRRFDERLAALRTPDAGKRLRAAMRGPATLRGKVKAGDSY
jgi:PHD/YefM family antitoxin component YafN of YafNO toxin-antitoxin module